MQNARVILIESNAGVRITEEKLLQECGHLVLLAVASVPEVAKNTERGKGADIAILGSLLLKQSPAQFSEGAKKIRELFPGIKIVAFGDAVAGVEANLPKLAIGSIGKIIANL